MEIFDCYVSWPKGKLQTCNSECDETTVQHSSKDIFIYTSKKQSIQNSPILEVLKVDHGWTLSKFETSNIWNSDLLLHPKKKTTKTANPKPTSHWWPSLSPWPNLSLRTPRHLAGRQVDPGDRVEAPSYFSRDCEKNSIFGGYNARIPNFYGFLNRVITPFKEGEGC